MSSLYRAYSKFYLARPRGMSTKSDCDVLLSNINFPIRQEPKVKMWYLLCSGSLTPFGLRGGRVEAYMYKERLGATLIVNLF